MQSSGASEGMATRGVPKSMRHKRILDVAEANPDAPLQELAAEIPSATPDLVERVLDEHGDPANTPAEEEPAASDSTTADESNYPDPETLTEQQYDALQAISEDPTATQRELAEKVGVAASTLCKRVKAIDGFEWAKRREFVTAVLGGDAPDGGEASLQDDSPPSDVAVDKLAERISALEDTVEDRTMAHQPSLIDENEDLLSKVVHACLKSDQVTDDEELRILKALI